MSFSAKAHDSPADGRLIVIVSREMEGEPRFQVSWGTETQQIFGIDVDGLKPAETARVDSKAAGHPLRSLNDLALGKYSVQAVLNIYETFHRADGHTVKLHMDHGEGQQWNTSPGNLMSKPKQVEIGADTVVPIELTEVIPPVDPPKGTKYVRHLGIESKLLTAFWGRPMHLGAIVLVPEGFDEKPQQHYPVAFKQTHFPGGFDFRETPPSSEMKGSKRRQADHAYRFFRSGPRAGSLNSWSCSPSTPRPITTIPTASTPRTWVPTATR